jgi:hypothetical protein
MIGETLRSARRHEYQGNLDKAKELYNKALSMDRDSKTAKRGLKRIREKLSQTDSNEVIGPGEMIRRMLRSPKKLSRNQKFWVKAIKETSDNFYRINFTPKQRRVIEDIYRKFVKKSESESKGST